MSNISRDCGEIWNRLFDHRPFLNGEVLYFQEEFEAKKSDFEIPKLFEILETVTDIRDFQINKIQTIGETSLPVLTRKLNKVLSSCHAVLESEVKFDIEENLQVKREIRRSDWERFQDEMKVKCFNADTTFDTKEKELNQFYVELESKLHIEDKL